MDIDTRLIDEGITIEASESDALIYEVRDRDGRLIGKEEFHERFGDMDAEASIDWTRTSDTRTSICGEGDSWINILWPISAVRGHEQTFFDVMQRTRRYRMLDQGYPGDTLKEIVEKKEYKGPIASGLYDYFIFSAAGNDVLGGNALRTFLKPRADVDPDDTPSAWLYEAEVTNALNSIERNYQIVAREITVWSNGRTKMLIHGYDYPIPREDGKWLGKPLQQAGYDLTDDAELVTRLMRYLVDQLYNTLSQVGNRHSHVQLINLRQVVAGRWNDELHPRAEGSEDIASLFMSRITPVA